MITGISIIFCIWDFNEKCVLFAFHETICLHFLIFVIIGDVTLITDLGHRRRILQDTDGMFIQIKN